MSLSERRTPGETLTNRYSSIGAIFVLIYSVMSAAKEVTVGHVVQDIEPNLLVFLSFGFVILIFNIDVFFNFSSFVKGWQIIYKNLRDIALLNLETALAWGCFFWAVRYLEPAVVSAVTVGISPLFSQLFGIERDNNRNVANRVFLSSIISLFLLITTYFGFSAMGDVNLSTFLIGSLLCGLGGAAISLVTSRSRKLYKNGYNSFDLMRTRFVLLVIISGLATLSLHKFDVDSRTFSIAGIIAIFGIAIPIFSLQKGLEKCGSTTALLIISCAPGFTWFFQLFDPRLHYSASTVVAIVGLFLVACWSIVSEQKQAK
ncbi:EamA-like transporter family [Serratia ficaria]|uniref:hypothetical protein n=1 Tax=Serratia ficaria TaxID=61651 RepID=UPI0021841D0A|nr:hypothetical protein [Serratia ficaria]CAI2534988.1 EamA-like transporter family [Serratia ficaria]